jgi:predicted dehydrogenase
MSNTLKAVMAGCGGISNAWLTACKEIPDLEIAGLVDLNENAAHKRQEEYHLKDARVGTDLAAVLEAIQPDMLFDCTVPEAHLPTTLTGLAHGCHVFGEKPMADTMEHARLMVDAAQKAGKLYAVIQNRRYQSEIRRLRQFLESGALGSVTTVNCDFYIGAHFGGFRDQMQHVLLLDMAIHTFDAARYISGANPVSVYCKEWNPAGSWYAHGASAVAIFEMSDGIVYTYRGSWCSEGLNTSWECDWRVIAQKGSLKWDGQQQLNAQVLSKTGGFFSEFEPVLIPDYNHPEKTGGHSGQIREFVECVRNGQEPETICSDNIHSLAMVHAAIRSAETGRVVRIDEL